MRLSQTKHLIAVLFSCALLSGWLWSGCSGDRLPGKPTFTEHIAPIVYQQCTYCHRTGGSAHFALEQYAQVKRYGPAIAFMARERLMPPWPADPHYTRFLGERVLTEQEIQTIERWVRDGMPEGPPDRLPGLPNFPIGSQIGKPDMRLAVAPRFLPAGASDQFLLVKVPFQLDRPRYVQVIEFVPGRNNVVHHVNGDLVRYQAGQKRDVFAGDLTADVAKDSTIMIAYQKLGLPNDDGTYPALQKSVVNYLPGVKAQRYPLGIGGYELPQTGAFLLNDLHYGFAKVDAWDSSYINLFFSPNPTRRPVREFQLGTIGLSPVEPDLKIEPNTVKHVRSKFKLPEDISILTVNPHMHLLGKSFKAYVLTPGGDTIRLISIPRWDFNWQYFYTFPKMLKAPKGSTIVAEGVYDNTRKNLNNPFSPPQLVQDQNGSMKATDEMFQFIVTYLPYEIGDENISLETP